MSEIFVTPAAGLLVRQPDGKPLPQEGAVVPRSSFWLSLLRDGDVVEATADTPAVPAAGTPAGTAAETPAEVAATRKKGAA